ncbi:MAG: hypothetical protein JNM51_06215 [Bacteroidia bacterium]|nr:hypothetical protein [Bacteroidia bacterium]
MNTTQAMIVLMNGIRKYGTIINGEYEGRIKFIPSAEIMTLNESQLANLIEHIPVSNIYSIDTFLK